MIYLTRNKTIRRSNGNFGLLWIFISIVFLPKLLLSWDSIISFDHIGANKKLSQNTVFCILQDSKGFIWFGTQKGLNRYDGRSIIPYTESNAILTNGKFGIVINTICEDKDCKIWIGTDKGLLKFNPTMESFLGTKNSLLTGDIKTICIDKNNSLWVGVKQKIFEVNPKSINIIRSIDVNNTINAICCGSNNGELWVGTENGLFRIFGKERKREEFSLLDNENNRSVAILSIYKDSENYIWVGTEDGKLFNYDKQQNKFRVCFTNELGIGLCAISEDIQNNLWLGFNGDGLFIYSKKTSNCIDHIVSNQYYKRSLSDNYLHAIYRDNVGTMWIGTQSSGVDRYNKNKEKFTTFYNMPNNQNSPNGISIFALFEDKNGFIWIGTYDGELSIYNPKENKFIHLKSALLARKSILTINDDCNGKLWIGTANGGFFHCIDESNGEFERIDQKVLGKKRIRVIKKALDGIHFWIGTEEKGIVMFNPLSKEFISSFSSENGLFDDNIFSIYPDVLEKNIIWVGTSKGLSYINIDSNTAKPVGNKENFRIFSIVQDPKKSNILWMGTDSIGLCKFDKNTGSISNFKKNQIGLADDIVYGILMDDSENAWVSTNQGISKFNTKDEKVERNFDIDDGLQANEFNSGAYLKCRTGKMYFGGINGLSTFYPEKILIDDSAPDIYFTNFIIANEKVIVGSRFNGKEILFKSITDTKKIELSYRQQPITLEFSALDYNVPSRIQYKYELIKNGKQVRGEWIPENSCTLPVLESGKYLFRVQSTNSDSYDEYIDLPNNKTAEVELYIIKNFFSDIIRPILLPLFAFFIVSSILVLVSYIFFKGKTKKRIRQLEMIEAAIDDVSRRENTDDVILRMLDCMVDSFGFDYAIISIRNFLNSTVDTIKGKTSKPDIININQNQIFKCKLSEDNIITEVIKKEEAIELPILKERNSTDLIKILIPILFRAKDKSIIEAEVNLVFGVVEAGFHKSTKSNIPKEMKLILELFLSYCSTLFYRALKRSEREIVDDLLKRSFEIDHHHDFLNMILRNSIKLIEGDKGDISFFSFNEKEINISDSPIFFNFDEKDKELVKKRNVSEKKGIVRFAAETNHFYYSNNVKEDRYYIEEFREVNSELAVPLRYFNRVIGVLNIYSNEKDFFDGRKANIIQLIADEAAKVYQKKKIDFTIKNLVLPFHLFEGSNEIYRNIINSIKDYFITEYVSVWERTGYGDDNAFKLSTACNSLKRKYDEVGLYSLTQDVFKLFRREINLISFSSNSVDIGFNKFARMNDFSSMILVPIGLAEHIYGFINIFSKRNLSELFPEDITFLNLIATKGAISVQHTKLITSFMEISDSLPSENLDRILGNIAESARKVLHADPVILFRYNQTNDTFSATFSGFLYHPELRSFVDHAKEEDQLLSYIIKKGSAWFDSSHDYDRYIKSIGRKHKGIHFKDDFWIREKIKSSVGICLKHKEESIGVMFFNYREAQRFDDTTKRFIEAFSSLAASAIVNARYLDLVEKQKKLLQKQTINLESQKDQLIIKQEKLESQYEEVTKKMSELLPKVTRASFYLIMRGINHDIRNLLIRIAQSMLEIEENSNRLFSKEKNLINLRIIDIEQNIENISNLLDLFDFKTPGTKTIDINSTIQKLTHFFKTRDSEAINFIIKKLNVNIPLITCNKAEFSMIIYNLLVNAVNAITQKHKLGGEIKIFIDFKNEEYIIIIEDNGIGIDKEYINHIYEAGFSTKDNGIGIGLYFVSETLRDNFWGTIECESHFGHWTRFIIKIPKSINYKEE